MVWKNHYRSKDLLLWIVIVVSLQLLIFLQVEKRFFGFFPQGYSCFLNFQIQSDNTFSLRKDKKEALPLGVFWYFYMGILCN
jgi:hypothetical protein